jgi:hypothetical protein
MFTVMKHLGPPQDSEYARCVQLSEQVSWGIDDVLNKDQSLDFSVGFLPESLASAKLVLPDPAEALKLNHIRGHSYVNLFVFVEEYIVAVAMQHAQAELFGSSQALRALLRFADEEVKHQQLFRRFQRAFQQGFGTSCDVVDNAVEVAGFILSKSPLAIMLVTLHLELVTQQHYVGAFRAHDGLALEPHFKSLFKHHWVEEAQHAKIDMLELRKLAHDSPAESRVSALADYCDILRAFDGLLTRQADLDLQSLDRALGRTLSDKERTTVHARQKSAYQEAFLVAGIRHDQLLPYAQLLDPAAGQVLSDLGQAWAHV